jgi:hypothetical protein
MAFLYLLEIANFIVLYHTSEKIIDNEPSRIWRDPPHSNSYSD